MKSRKCFWILTLTICLLLMNVSLAHADNCSSPGDCYGSMRSGAQAAAAIALILMVLSLALDFHPFFGPIKGFIEMATGYDPITGDKLDLWERALGVLPDIGKIAKFSGALAAIAGGMMRHGDEAAEIASAVSRHGDEFIEGAGSVARHADEAADLGRHADEAAEVGKHADEAANLERHADEAADLGKHTDEAAEVGKYADEAADLGKHTDEAAEVGKHADEAAHEGSEIAKVNQPRLFPNNMRLSGRTAGTGGIREIHGRILPDLTKQVTIRGELRPSLPREGPGHAPNFNNGMRSGNEVGLKDYDLAHLWGPGFGDEARDGIMHAPREVNRVLQNPRVEERLRELQRLALKEDATIEVTARATSHPLEAWRSSDGVRRGNEVLKQVSYRVDVRHADRTTQRIAEIDIHVPPPTPSGTYPGGHVIEVTPGSAEIWSLK